MPHQLEPRQSGSCAGVYTLWPAWVPIPACGSFLPREVPPWNLSTDELEFENADESGGSETSVQRAAIGGRAAELATLLSTPAGRAAGLQTSPPPLYLACMGGHEGCVRTLLEAGAVPDGRTANGRTALFAACRGGHASCASLLLDRRANPNDRDVNGCTALFAACAKQRVECVQLLLTCGADANLPAQDANIEPPPDLTPAMLLAGSPVGMEPQGRGWLCLQALGQAGANLNARSGIRAMSALCLAAAIGRLEATRLLLQSGADIEQGDVDGDRPLALASYHGQAKVCCLAPSRPFSTSPSRAPT
jgi:ankyrin repeat protein